MLCPDLFSRLSGSYKHAGAYCQGQGQGQGQGETSAGGGGRGRGGQGPGCLICSKCISVCQRPTARLLRPWRQRRRDPGRGSDAAGRFVWLIRRVAFVDCCAFCNAVDALSQRGIACGGRSAGLSDSELCPKPKHDCPWRTIADTKTKPSPLLANLFATKAQASKHVICLSRSPAGHVALRAAA